MVIKSEAGTLQDHCACNLEDEDSGTQLCDYFAR